MNKNDTEKLLYAIKNETPTDIPSAIPIYTINKQFALFPATKSLLADPFFIKLLNDWRKTNQKWFPSQFPVTIKRTRIWAKEQVMDKPDRILYFIKENSEKTPIGHMGLYRFDYKKQSLEIDNVIRGIESDNTRGIMTDALNALIGWTKENIKPKKIFLTVFSDNAKAIALYKRAGFVEYQKIPLKKIRNGNIVLWQDTEGKADRYELKMVLSK